jgi:hypothetical protein
MYRTVHGPAFLNDLLLLERSSISATDSQVKKYCGIECFNQLPHGIIIWYSVAHRCVAQQQYIDLTSCCMLRLTYVAISNSRSEDLCAIEHMLRFTWNVAIKALVELALVVFNRYNTEHFDLHMQ